MVKYIKIVFAIAICLSIFVMTNQMIESNVKYWDFLQSLSIAFFDSSVFEYVGIAFFTLLGLSSGIVFVSEKADQKVKNIALQYFFAQLALYVFWVYLFFELRNFLLALIEIVILILIIYETHLKFLKINNKITYLLIPYFIYVLYAFMVNICCLFLD